VSDAWLYAVVSSGAQESTLVDQEHWAREASSANGWELTRVFSAVSTGKAGVRKLLTRLVGELRATPKAERPARVLMLRLDRVGRGSLIDSMVVLRELEDLGVGVFTRDGGEEKMDGPMREFITAAKLAVAGFENAVRREKSIAFHARKKAAGEYGGRLPYGFVCVDKRLTVYEPEAQVVRAIFEKRISGQGYQRISQYAATNGPPKLRPNGEHQAFTWAPNTIISILTNPKYRGVVVSENVWDAAAEMKGTMIERHAVRWPWPLRGAVRCTCGALLLGEASGRRVHRLRYYVCRRLNLHQNPSFPHHNAERMEEQFIAILERLEPHGDLQPATIPQADTTALTGRKNALFRERGEIEKRRSRTWELGEDEAIDRSELAQRLDALRIESDRVSEALRAVERELANATVQERSSGEVSEAFKGLPKLWPLLTVEVQRDVARAVAAYLGGFWADPNRPGILLYGSATNDDGSPRNVEISSVQPSSLETARRVLLQVGRMGGARGSPTGLGSVPPVG